MRKLNLLPLLIIPLLSTGYVLREGIIENPWFGKLPSSDALPKLEAINVKSDYTDVSYRIEIQPPIGYSADGEAYPVLYVIDQASSTTTFDQVWAPLLKNRQVPDTIVVYVSYLVNRQAEFMKEMQRAKTGSKVHGHTREDDFTYHVDPKDEANGGKADQFTKFLELEVFPKVEGKYHTNPDDRAIAGFGQAASYAAMVAFHSPDLFHRIVAVGPFVPYANNVLVEDVKALGPSRTARSTTRMYLGMGEDDYEVRIAAFETLRDTLKQIHVPNLEYRAEILLGRTYKDMVYPGSRAGLKYVYAK